MRPKFHRKCVLFPSIESNRRGDRGCGRRALCGPRRRPRRGLTTQPGKASLHDCRSFSGRLPQVIRPVSVHHPACAAAQMMGASHTRGCLRSKRVCSLRSGRQRHVNPIGDSAKRGELQRLVLTARASCASRSDRIAGQFVARRADRSGRA
jgi:hypothetical protein